jgi:menaquinone-specific isochorismate synthase
VNNPDSFKDAVRSALNSIQANQYKKIVLARSIDVTSQTPFHIFHSLNHLRRLHPDCYIFATGNSKGQTFIGASPERLVSLHDRHLTTDALAGSAPRGQTPAEDADLAQAMLNSEKERREHQAVIDFIVERLSHLGLAPQLSSPARLLQLANIQHLWTPIHARVPAEISLLDIVAELHPTPAVAGVPRDIACQEIRRYETFDRSLYAAPLGWLDRQGNGEFIVGIRSAIIDGCHARLFAGAGIVAGSAPEKELAEIQLKLQALLKALV